MDVIRDFKKEEKKEKELKSVSNKKKDNLFLQNMLKRMNQDRYT
jgi:hypothetical protein